MSIITSSSGFSLSKSGETENQDSVLYPREIDDGYLFAVADGVGGYKGGKEASTSVISYLSNYDSTPRDVDYLFEKIKNNLINLAINNKDLASASTTLTFCHASKDGLVIGHIGDCRLYIKKDNKLIQVTKDHTQHQMLIDEGYFTAREVKKAQGKNIITAAISSSPRIPFKYQSLFIPKNELQLENGALNVFIMSDGAHSHWIARPRFSAATLSSPAKFASSLQRRIELKGPEDDYSLIAIKLLL